MGAEGGGSIGVLYVSLWREEEMFSGGEAFSHEELFAGVSTGFSTVDEDTGVGTKNFGFAGVAGLMEGTMGDWKVVVAFPPPLLKVSTYLQLKTKNTKLSAWLHGLIQQLSGRFHFTSTDSLAKSIHISNSSKECLSNVLNKTTIQVPVKSFHENFA